MEREAAAAAAYAACVIKHLSASGFLVPPGDAKGHRLDCCCCRVAPAAAVDKLASPKDFFTACYHTLLCCGGDTEPGTTGEGGGGSGTSGKITQQLCVKAMAAGYSAHAGTIGPFEGIPHLLQLLDGTPQRSLRHGLLLLLQALIAPRAAGDLQTPPLPLATAASSSNGTGTGLRPPATLSPTAGAAGTLVSNGASTNGPAAAKVQPTAPQAAAVSAAKANGYLLMDHGGLELLVDLVAGAHECTERRMAAAAAAGAGGAAAGTGHMITSISHAEVRG
jgi:DnaJ family protein C protein 13